MMNARTDGARSYWTSVAALKGHSVVFTDNDGVTVMKLPARRPNHAAWGIGALILLVSALFTLGLSLILFVPYLVAWAILAGRSTRGPMTYSLWVDQDGRPVTNPPSVVWTLLAAERKMPR